MPADAAKAATPAQSEDKKKAPAKALAKAPTKGTPQGTRKSARQVQAKELDGKDDVGN